jgi:hypothetical protein
MVMGPLFLLVVQCWLLVSESELESLAGTSSGSCTLSSSFPVNVWPLLLPLLPSWESIGGWLVHVL